MKKISESAQSRTSSPTTAGTESLRICCKIQATAIRQEPAAAQAWLTRDSPSDAVEGSSVQPHRSLATAVMKGAAGAADAIAKLQHSATRRQSHMITDRWQ